MSDEYTLSLSQVALRLNAEGIDIAESTVRKYARLYKEFLPSRKLEGERWEKYPSFTINVVRRIFTLSDQGKSRHEIKTILKADGFTITVDGDTSSDDDTVSDPTLSHNDTPSPPSLPHLDGIPESQQKHYELIAHYNASVIREAAESLRLYHRLMEEKNVQLQELEALVEKLKGEKQSLRDRYQAELLKVLDDVAQWRSRKADQPKRPERKLETA